MGRPKLTINSDLCLSENCISKPRCKGLCQRCYRRKYYDSVGRAKIPGRRKVPRLQIGDTFVCKGYVHEKVDHKKFKPQHRLVMERFIGRELLPCETVHHRNGCGTDNRLDNLELWASAHPGGQRVTDLLTFAREILERYGHLEL